MTDAAKPAPRDPFDLPDVSDLSIGVLGEPASKDAGWPCDGQWRGIGLSSVHEMLTARQPVLRSSAMV